MNCPCCSGRTYESCCGPLHAGGVALTAEALMRSRYCAFARRDIPYLVKTTHSTLRAKLMPKDFLRTFALGWSALEIIAVQGGGPTEQQGVVHFRATHSGGVHEEKSTFVRVQGEWMYRDDRGKIQ